MRTVCVLIMDRNSAMRLQRYVTGAQLKNTGGYMAGAI